MGRKKEESKRKSGSASSLLCGRKGLEYCVGDSATRTPGDIIFDKYVMSRHPSRWFGTVGEENMRVWEEPRTSGSQLHGLSRAGQISEKI